MLGKQAIIEFLETNNINNIFHLPGIHTLPLNESLTRHNINVFIGRHEANIMFMALGYARTSGKAGLVVVTPGPGLGNTVSGCMEAYSDDVPLLIIHVDTGREEIGKGILHELVEPESMFTHFTKKTFAVSNPDGFIPALDEAYRTVMSGRKGPVVVSLPYTLFEKKVPLGLPSSSRPSLQTLNRQARRLSYNSELRTMTHDLDAALKGKKKLVIIGGKSLMFEEARPILDEMCREASIPFLTSTGGKGIIREDSTYTFGNIMQKGVARDIITSSDIVIAIGTRLRDVDAKRRGVKIKELIHIDIDEQWIGKNYPAKVRIAGDIKQALECLRQVIKGKRFEWDIDYLKKAQKKEWAALQKASPGFRMVKLLRETIPDDTTTVCELNYPSYWAEYFFPVYHQNTFIIPRGMSPVFYCLPASIGAKIGRPDRPCLCLAGDGGVLPTIGELATIKKYNIPVVLLVYNNNSFGILEDIMAERYGVGGPMKQNNPDFVRVANAFDIKAKRTKTLDGLKKIFMRDIAWDEPFLVEFESPVFPPPWRV